MIEPVLLCDESKEWRVSPSTVFWPVEGVGVFAAQFEWGSEEGLSVRDVLDMMGFTEEPIVASATTASPTLEQRVANSLQSMAADDAAARDGQGWTLPNLAPTESVVPPGPELQGSDREAWKSVSIGPDLPVDVVARVRSLCEEFRDVLGG